MKILTTTTTTTTAAAAAAAAVVSIGLQKSWRIAKTRVIQNRMSTNSVKVLKE